MSKKKSDFISAVVFGSNFRKCRFSRFSSDFEVEDLSRRGQMGRGSVDPRLIQGTGHHNMRQFLTKVGQKHLLEG